jgi:hypothetical protein
VVDGIKKDAAGAAKARRGALGDRNEVINEDVECLGGTLVEAQERIDWG